MVMDASRCRQVELGRSCTVSCSEGFTGESNFNCQTDGVSLLQIKTHSVALLFIRHCA